MTNNEQEILFIFVTGRYNMILVIVNKQDYVVDLMLFERMLLSQE